MEKAGQPGTVVLFFKSLSSLNEDGLVNMNEAGVPAELNCKGKVNVLV